MSTKKEVLQLDVLVRDRAELTWKKRIIAFWKLSWNALGGQLKHTCYIIPYSSRKFKILEAIICFFLFFFLWGGNCSHLPTLGVRHRPGEDLFNFFGTFWLIDLKLDLRNLFSASINNIGLKPDSNQIGIRSKVGLRGSKVAIQEDVIGWISNPNNDSAETNLSKKLIKIFV